MKKTLPLLLLFLAFSSAVLAQDIVGNWLGTLEIMGNKLRIGFHIEKQDTVYTAKMDSPDQGAFGLPTTRTSLKDNQLEITASGLGIFYRGTWANDTISGTFNQGGLSFPLMLTRAEKPALNRPQEPQPPFPYRVEEVVFTSGKEKTELSGTLTLPDSAGTFPCVVLVAGSGPNDRDETVFGHKPFLVLADHLTRNGFAVLRYDKRGVGQSKGNPQLATLADFADDAQAAAAFLRARKEIDRRQIGLIGHSEGGIVAPMVASRDKNIAFIVLMAAPGTSGIDIVMAQNEILMRAQGMESENIERLQTLNHEIFQYMLTWENTETNRTDLRERISHLWEQFPILVKMRVKKDAFVRQQFNGMVLPAYRSFLKSNPEDFLTKVRVPVLAINGENDTQVPYEANLQGIRRALEKGRNLRHETKSYPKLNHLFQESETGAADEYAKIEQTIAPEVLDDITNWMKRPAD